MRKLEGETWSWSRACMGWVAVVPVVASPNVAMADVSCRLLDLLPGFATAWGALWTTRHTGRATAVFDRAETIDRRTVATMFLRRPDTDSFTLHLDLCVRDGNETEAIIEDGGRLLVELETSRLLVELGLNVDVYLRHTFGRNTDNRRLARLNAHRPNAFLGRLGEVLNVGFEFHTEICRYRSQATAHGFPFRCGPLEHPG